LHYRIYKLQDDGYTFQTVEQFLRKLDPNFFTISQNSMRSLLKYEKLSDAFIDQLASAACLVNYNQSIEIQGFVGIVSLAGAYANLWNVRSKSGNKEIPEELLKLSGANVLLNTRVTSVRPEKFEFGACGNQTTVTYVQNGVENSKTYDYVVIAFPMTKNLDNFELDFGFDYSKYQMQLTKTYFIEGNVCLYPEIPLNRRVELIGCDDGIDFRSVSVQLPCDYNQKVDSKLWLDDGKKLYKVFSRINLDDGVLRKIFRDDYKIKKEIDWYAYPKYDVLSSDGTKPIEFPPVIIDSNERSRVFYLNSMEWSASCMETSCISARNIALLISNKEQTIEKTRKMNKKFKKSSIFGRFFGGFCVLSVVVLAVAYKWW
jgi:prenylcysteine oxidase/farnesylcysteine lyase